ncbi:hypothetical protein D3C80_1378410 [compost metagenome]
MLTIERLDLPSFTSVMSTPLTAPVTVLEADSSSSPSSVYLAFCGLAMVVTPVAMLASPPSVSSVPSPILVEENTSREPLASVTMFAVMPLDCNCPLMVSRACCRVAPLAIVTLWVALPWLMVRVCDSPESLTIFEVFSYTCVEIFDAVASCVTSRA